MSPERQRVVIAELCGWKWVKSNTEDSYAWYGPTGLFIDRHQANGRTPEQVAMDMRYCIPNYLNDLNAMHEAERIFLTNQLGPAYQNWLNRLNAEDMEFGVYHVTAAQRAEALLRTLNKWEDAR